MQAVGQLAGLLIYQEVKILMFRQHHVVSCH